MLLMLGAVPAVANPDAEAIVRPAQPEGWSTLTVGFGYGYSLLYPKAVNREIDRWKRAQEGDSKWGQTPIFYAGVPQLFVAVAPARNFLFRISGELGYTYKLAVFGDGERRFFHYNRYSVGGMVSGVIPFGEGLYEFMMGLGVYYHRVHFEKHTGDTPGYRAEMAFRFNEYDVRPELVFALDYIKTMSDELELNYTSATVGVRLSWGVGGSAF